MSLKKVLNYLVLVLCLLPVLMGFLYVFLFGVNVVFWDQWAVVPLFEKFYAGTLSFSDFFAQHNEHRMFFPRIAMLFLGILTKYNNIVEMYFIQFFLIITMVIIFWAAKKQFDIKTAGFWLVPVPFLIFSLRQHENMLFGIQIIYVFATTFSLLAFFLLSFLPELAKTKFRRLSFIFALASATIPSYSMASGLLVWPVGFFQIALWPKEALKKKFYAGIWIVLGFLEWFIYFFNYKKPGQPDILYGLYYPLKFIKFFFTFLGSSLFWNQTPALAAGIIISVMGLISIFLLCRHNRLKENSFWLAIGIFSLLTNVSIAAGRVGMGVGEALATRYATFSILGLVALYIILLDLMSSQKQKYMVPLMGLILGSIMLSLPFSYIQGFSSAKTREVRMRSLAFMLSTYESYPDEFLTRLFISAEVVKEGAAILNKLNYNVFADEPRVINPPFSDLSFLPYQTGFSIDKINEIEIDRQKLPLILGGDKDFVIIKGWAIDTRANDLAGGVYLDIDGNLYPAFYGTNRRDIEKQFKVSAYKYSGFEGAIPAANLKPGLHRLTLKILTKDQKAYYQPEPTVSFEVK